MYHDDANPNEGGDEQSEYGGPMLREEHGDDRPVGDRDCYSCERSAPLVAMTVSRPDSTSVCYLCWSENDGARAKLSSVSSCGANAMSRCGVNWSILNFAAEAWLTLPLPTYFQNDVSKKDHCYMEFRCLTLVGQFFNKVRLCKKWDPHLGCVQQIQTQLREGDVWPEEHGSWTMLADGSVKVDYEITTSTLRPGRHVYRQIRSDGMPMVLWYGNNECSVQLIRVDECLGWRIDVLDMLKAAGFSKKFTPILQRFLD